MNKHVDHHKYFLFLALLILCGAIRYQPQTLMQSPPIINIFLDKTQVKKIITEKDLKWLKEIPERYLDINITLPVFQNDLNITGVLFNLNHSQHKLSLSECAIFGVSYHFYRFRNVYHRGDYAYVCDDISYKIDKKSKKVKNQNVTLKFNTLVTVTGFATSKYFGDALCGMIKLIFIPKEILNQAVVMYTYKVMEKYIYEILDICGVQTPSIVHVHETKIVFARELYTILPMMTKNDPIYEANNGYFGDFVNCFVRRVEKFYNITNIKAESYGIINREKGMKRYVKNFNQIFQRMKREHPSINFKIISHSYNSLYEGAVTLRAQKWVFAPTGSSLFYAMFMLPGMRVCFYMGNWFDFPCLGILTGAQLNFVGFINNFKHFHHKPIKLNVTTVCHYVNVSLQER